MRLEGTASSACLFRSKECLLFICWFFPSMCVSRQKEKRMKRLRQKNQQKLNEYIDS